MGFFSVNKEVLPIGISLRVPIGTRSDGKLNLIFRTTFIKLYSSSINNLI